MILSNIIVEILKVRPIANLTRVTCQKQRINILSGAIKRLC